MLTSSPTIPPYLPALLAATALSCLVPNPFSINDGDDDDPICGDGHIDADEACDLGLDNRDDGPCTSTCAVASCGDGLIHVGVEECDDSNTLAGDGCSANCRLENTGMCGDGVVAGDEECDDGENNDDQGACKTDCTMQMCGDGHVGLAEGCDDGNTESGDGCSEACLSENCGDGVVNGSEECDDGNDVSTDACVACVSAGCGDGFVWDGEEQCEDGDDDDTDECVDCMNATCGDGFVWAGMEQCDNGMTNDNSAACKEDCTSQMCGDGHIGPGEDCDDGNADNDDACVELCVSAGCGDGFTQAGVEQCDDGNQTDLDGCSSNCTYDARRVFVTSTLHTGNLGGVAGADMICNTRAQDAGLPGTYMAWISTNVDMIPLTPADRFAHANVPYVLVDGTRVADNWADLIDGTLDNPIVLTEFGQLTPETTVNCNGARVVRTGTAPDGTLGVGLGRCNNFTQAGNGAVGTIGRATSTVGEWSQCGQSIYSCTDLLPIYCFEQ